MALQTKTIIGSTNNSNWTWKMELIENSTDTSANTSSLTVNSYLGRASSASYFGGNASVNITCNGVSRSTSKTFTYPTNVSGGGWVLVQSETFTVTHNSDGSKNVDVSSSMSTGDFTPSYASASGSITLTKIPRYANITSFIVNKRDETSVSISWGTDATCDYVWYSKNNGSSWNKLPSDNIVTGLKANTSYIFKLRVRRKDSQLTTDSEAYTQTTYNYPYCIEAPNFTIRNNVTIKLYNPLNRTIKIQMWSHVSQQFVSDLITINGTSYTGFSDAASRLYASIPNVKSSGYNIYVLYEGNKAIKEGGSYTIRGDENPTFGVENIIDVVDTLNVAITGDNTKFIKGHNTLTGVITPMSSNYYANLDYYSISATGLATQTKNYSTSNVSFTLNNITTNSFVVNAVDKRTISTLATKSITLINYDNPTLTEAVITRQNGTGTYINVDFKGNYTNWQGLAQNNFVSSAKYRYKKVGNSTWSSWVNIPTSAITNTNGVWEIKTTFNTVFSNTDKYDLELSITDKLETVSFTGLVISTANAFIWKDLQNKFFGVCKKPSKTLDVAGDVNVDNALYVNGVKIIWYE